MRPTTIALLAVLALTLFFSWFFATHERVTVEEYVGYQGEARYNGFLAAEMLLGELALDADSIAGITPESWLPDSADTLVTRLYPGFAVGAGRDALSQWVAAGGHLVLLPPAAGSQLTDDFLAGFGLRLQELESSGESDDATAGPDRQDDGYDYRVDLEHTVLRILPIGQQALSATLSDDHGYVAVRRSWEDGYLTVLAASHYFVNEHLDDSDHARLLLDAVAGYVDPGKVWFVYNASFPSLGSVILDHLPYLAASLTAAVLLWIWAIVPVFGPPVSGGEPERRSILEHVHAAGRFAWQNGGIDTLGAAAKAATLHRAEARHPGISRLPAVKQARRLAHITGLPEQRIQDVLVDPGEPQHRAFTENMQLLHRIRESL